MPASSSSCSSSSFLSRSSWGKNGCNLHAIRRNGSGIFQVYWSNLTYGMGSYGCLKIGHPKSPLVYHRFQAIHWNSSINSVVGSPPQCASGALVPAARPHKSFWEPTAYISFVYIYIQSWSIIYMLSLVCWFTVLYMCKVCFMILSAYCCARVCICLVCVLCLFCVCARISMYIIHIYIIRIYIYIILWYTHTIDLLSFWLSGCSSFQAFDCGEAVPPLAVRVHVFGAPAPLASWQARLIQSALAAIPTRISGNLRTSSHTIKRHHHTSYIVKQPHTSTHPPQWSDALRTHGRSFHLYRAELYNSWEWDEGTVQPSTSVWCWKLNYRWPSLSKATRASKW